MPAQSANSRDHNDPLIHFVDFCIHLSLLVVVLSLLSINSQIVDKRKLARFSQQEVISQVRLVDGSAPLATVKGETDSDGDGFSDRVENYIGTDPTKACGPRAWPPDINNDAKVNLNDYSLISTAIVNFSKNPPVYNKRFDLNADGAVNITDRSLVVLANKKTGGLACKQPASPVVSVWANGSDGPITISYNSQATISWTSQNATSCTVSSPGWTGTTGRRSTGNLTSSQTYTLNCLNNFGSASDSVTVNVSAPPCTGTMTLTLDPAEISTAPAKTIDNVKATVSGLSNCSGRDVLRFFIYTTEGKKDLGPRYLNLPPSITLTAPTVPYPSGYLVEVYLDRGSDAPYGPYDLGPAAAYLKVLEPPPPSAPPPPPPPQPEHTQPQGWPAIGKVGEYNGFGVNATHGDSVTGQAIDVIQTKADGRVFATMDGTVNRVATGYNGGCGGEVVIISTEGYLVRYCHLQSISVSENNPVSFRQSIGIMSSEGYTDGAVQVHYGIAWPGAMGSPNLPVEPLGGFIIDNLDDTLGN